MKVAVTGATGFIGRYIVRHLVEQRHECRCWYRTTSDRGGFAALNIQSMEILQLPVRELQERIAKELADNVVPENVKNDGRSSGVIPTTSNGSPGSWQTETKPRSSTVATPWSTPHCITRAAAFVTAKAI